MSYAQAQAILDGQPLCEGWEIDGGPGHLAQLQSDLRNLATFSQVNLVCGLYWLLNDKLVE
jgi:hypothetical protein